MFHGATAFNQNVSKWNTGAVTSMQYSKCHLSPSLWPRFPLLCFFNTTTRVSSCQFSRCLFCWFFFGTFFSFLHPLLQCFMTQLRSIRTCPNGIRVRCTVWNVVSVFIFANVPSHIRSDLFSFSKCSKTAVSHKPCAAANGKLCLQTVI